MDEIKIKEDFSWPSLLETKSTVWDWLWNVSQSNQWLFFHPHYWARYYQKKWDVLQDLFLWLALLSPPIQNERPLLSLFIWLNDYWMDSSQLIRQWQEALLLAHWPTPTEDRNRQHNSNSPQIDFQTPSKPFILCSSLWHVSMTRLLKLNTDRVVEDIITLSS